LGARPLAVAQLLIDTEKAAELTLRACALGPGEQPFPAGGLEREAVVHTFVIFVEEPSLRSQFGASYGAYLRSPALDAPCSQCSTELTDWRTV
jgi:hypothetical protein